ncbi:MAG TPA: DUF2490 domain-containing protein [Puia sp.]|jgi:hypothetical protein
MHRSITLILLLLAAIPHHARSQTQFSGWLGTFQNYKITGKTGLYFDAQIRSTGQWQQVHALLLRPGLNLYLTPSLTTTVGYAYIPQQRISGNVTALLPEHRAWQQLLFTHPARIGHNHPHRTTPSGHPKHPVLTASFSHRLRLEQRYLPLHHPEGNTLVQHGHRYAGRLRYFTRGLIPLNSQASPGQQTSTPPFTKGFFAAIQNEIFFNIGDPSPVNGKVFDQNRAYVAAGYRLNRQFDMELGYMNQYINGTGSNSTNNHILQMATYIRL